MREDVGDADPLEPLCRLEPRFSDDFRERAPQPSQDRVLFDDDNRIHRRRGGQKGLDVERLHGRHVQHARRNAVGAERGRRVERDLQRNAGRDEQHVAAADHRNRAADFERRVERHDRIAALAQADVQRPLMGGGQRHEPSHLVGIAGRHDGHVRNGAHDRDVVDRQVRRSERRIDHTAAAADETHVRVVQTAIEDDLLETSPRDERRDRVHIDDSALERESGRHADDVRLAHAFHEESIREVVLELIQRADPEIGAHEHDALVLPGQLVHAIETRLPHQCASSAASSRSASCAVTLFWWCHAMLFSANATPLPLTV